MPHLFRPKSNGKLGYLQDNDVIHFEGYESVIQFVPHNKIIPAKIEALSQSPDLDTTINGLLEAFQNDELNHKAFLHPDAQIHLLYLLKTKQISSQFFLQANLWLCALMTYTDLQPLNEQDHKMKKSAELKLFSLDDLTIRRHFTHSLKNNHYERYSKEKFDREVFDERMRQLSKLGKTIIGIKKLSSRTISSNDLYLSNIASGSPLCA